jgi:hypothetical protein
MRSMSDAPRGPAPTSAIEALCGEEAIPPLYAVGAGYAEADDRM